MNMTLQQLLDRFPTEDACKTTLVARRWPNGVRCPRCDSEKVTRLRTRSFAWQCRQCDKRGYRFSVLVGTVFENTNIKLRVWFQAIYLMCQSKKGMSALQIQRTLGLVSYESAWYMCHRIRAAMQNGEFKKLTGVVEIDETYVGGVEGNKHKDKRGKMGHQGKVTVIGAISRKGNVTARVIERMNHENAARFVKDTVNEVVELVATDQHQAYRHMAWGPFQKHESVDHSKEEYVRGIVHTANIDSFWSLLKRGIMGSFHHVSKEYLPMYINEFCFRYNNRKNADMFDRVLAAC